MKKKDAEKLRAGIREFKNRMTGIDPISKKPIEIIVWGSGKHGANYQKREKIRTAIMERFVDAIVYFPEDPAIRKIYREEFPGLDEVEHERIQASRSNLILALDTSKGVGEEIAKYSEYGQIRKKIIVLSHVRYQKINSFANSVRRSLDPVWYSDDQFNSCSLATVTCPSIVEAYIYRRIEDLGNMS